MSSRPITPVSPVQSARPEASIHSARPGSARISSRPVSYAGTQHTQPIESTAHPNHSQTALQDPPAGASGVETHDEDVSHTQDSHELPRTDSHMSGSQTLLPSRGGTLKKKASLHKSASLKRSASKRSSYAGSVRSLQLGEKEKYDETPETNSVFYTPVPTTGNPTELLATRFQAWRKVLKDLINYFRELHKTYDLRAKALMSTTNVINNTTIPSNFLSQGGLGDAAYILRNFHKQGLNEANKARDLENEVIIQLTGLRSDLQQKIKEIKGLSGDFKNSVEKEKDVTKRSVQSLQEAIGSVDQDAAATTGKGDPFLVKLSLDKQLEKQIDEENYLHRAYLNLEASGRELESIVVGEIQKAYNVLAGVLRREADENYDTAEKLKEGPLALAKDFEWDQFTTNNSQMVDPRIPIRQVSHIVYPGKDHPAAIEVKSGMLERKSKYLKNYTPGWYVLSPTHLHEFKSADRIAFQSPVMSLYLPEQKLGTHSETDSSSHKFMLKGRQTGSMHRGHAWVFRAESHDTMLAWFNDIKELTEKRGEERNEFVRRTHARSLSGNSLRPASIVSSEGDLEDDEADRAPFSGEQSVRGNSVPPAEGPALAGVGGVGAAAALHDNEDDRSEAGWRPPPQRPAPGGRFPSDVNVQRGLQAPLSPSSAESSDPDRDIIAAAGALPGSGVPFVNTPERHTDLQADTAQPAAPAPQLNNANQYTQGHHPNILPSHQALAPHDGASEYGEWMAPIAAGGGAAAGAALAASAIQRHKQQQEQEQHDRDRTPTAAQRLDGESAIPQYGESSGPILVATAAPIDAPTGPRAMSESTTAPSSAVANTISSSTDAETLSTVPTSTSYTAPNGSLFDANGVFVGPRTSNTAPTDYVLKPSDRSHSNFTISHLHVPGEFPSAQVLHEDSRIYQGVVQQ
ncbi:phosphatidylinositol 4,5-bisphosphate-binding protein [Cladophialophora chaetospira]|uniref:Phosphatidylinositol 4,5-bisphosphate-binding protein n=1 Tax=Cladophialophora chaetospira TaxID=386627 RepID=A0AA38XLN4_9EURO|nr:phosphatidylinositol 4,5-bisphosphate-binding protein [Cladophialophora chaetospira]